MKKYLNPLLLAPVLGFLIPFFIALIITLGDIDTNFLNGSAVFGILIFGILLLNIWNYNISPKNTGKNYFNFMVVTVFIFSSFLYSVLMSNNNDWVNGLITIIPIYILCLIILIGLNIHTHIKVIRGQDLSQRPTIIIKKQSSFPRIGFPLLIGFGLSLYYILWVDIPEQSIYRLLILLIRYIFISLINRNLLSDSLLYKIIMFLIVLLSVPYADQGISIDMNNTFIYESILLKFVIYGLGSLLLLIVICVISNILYTRKSLQTQ